MAGEVYTGVPTVDPAGTAPGVYQSLRTPQVDASMFGGASAEGLTALGQGASRAATFFGEAAADNAATEYQVAVNKILHGDPAKTVTGPDGQPTPELGFMELKGRAAMDARPGVVKQMEDLRKSIHGQLPTPQMQTRFDGFSRRFKAITDAEVGRHADTQANQWYTRVNKAGEANALESAARNADNPAALELALHDVRRYRVQQAQLEGGGPELINHAMESADRDVAIAQIRAIGATDPQKALRIAENNKKALGLQYDNVVDHLRPRAEQQWGRQRARGLLTEAPPPAGDDTKAVIRHFEDFRETPYWDVNHWRIGYGSDTITRADGTKEVVTENSRVTREDAERDLERRAAESQSQARVAVGAEAFDKLSPRAKASLTSISYNYGPQGFPRSVAEAARTGDPKVLAEAVRALGSHNNGINAGRRASEANNISPREGAPEGGDVRDPNQMIAEVRAMNMPPGAEAAAISEIQRSFAQRQDTMVRRRTAFETTEKNSLAEVQELGTPPANPIPKSEFIRHYGQADGALRFENYESNVQFGVDYKMLEGMSNAQQDAFLATRAPREGSPAFAREVANVKRLREGVTRMQKERREDPSSAVARMPAVADALKTYDEKQPETFQLVGTARMEAQKEMGIDEPFRSPISKPEALQQTLAVQMALPGKKMDELEKLGARYRAMFGDNAERALIYSLRAIHLQGQAAVDAEGVLTSLSRGLPVTQEERRDAREKQDAADIERSLAAGRTSPAPTDAWMDSSGVPSPPAQPKEPGTRPTPNSAAILALRANPQSASEFDQVYGAGAAKKLMEQFPLYFKGPAK